MRRKWLFVPPLLPPPLLLVLLLLLLLLQLLLLRRPPLPAPLQTLRLRPPSLSPWSYAECG
jgi:hypothetical protein